MDEYSIFENDIINKLETSGLIERFSSTEIKPNPDIKIINELFEYPCKIDSDIFGIFYINEDNDKVYCPKMDFSISDSGEWLSDRLPPVPFDVEQSGNVRKSDEAEALYCAIVIAHILKEPIFKEEIRKMAKTYDFTNMKNNIDQEQTFRGLINDWQSQQSVIINIIISACKFRISYFKKDMEKFLRDGISEEEVVGLRELQAVISAKNFAYSDGELSPTNLKNLSKIDKLRLIDKRDAEISILIANSKAGVLYKLLNLSTEYISPIKKKKIQLWVKTEVDRLIDGNVSYSTFKVDRSQLISKLQRRALKFERNSVRKLHIERFLSDRPNFKFPSKQ
jgi:hypothetical protein